MYFDELIKNGDQELKIKSTYLASASVDSTINIWSRHQSDQKSESKFNLDQTLSCKSNGFALALKFHLLPLSNCNYFALSIAL
jgi:hypothetical protein